MHILGIDPGFDRAPTAAALLHLDGHTITLVQTWLIRSAAREWQAKHDQILHGLHPVLMTHAVDLVSYELAWLGKNPQTALRMEGLGGGVRGLAVACGLPCIGVAPAQSKQALTGRANASKAEMIAAMRVLFGRDLSEHEADAVGHALAGEAAWRRRTIMEAAQ